MSFILDALKKAEAEKDPDLRASLAIGSQVNRRQRMIQYLIIVALLGNLLVLVWLFGPTLWKESTRPADAGAESILPAEAPTTAGAASGSPAPSTVQPAVTPMPESVGRADPTVRPATPVRPAPVQRTTLAELDSRTRARFPDLEFSTHVYASETAMRAVVVNGQRLTEGDQFEDVTLEEITESGVVVRFENYLVTIAVLENWD